MSESNTLMPIAVGKLFHDIRSANRMDDERYGKLKENIRRSQKYPPLIIRPHPKKAETFIIIDGHYRLKALKELGYSKILCICWDVDEAEAALLLATMNRLRGEDHPKKRAELLQEVLIHFEKKQLIQLIPENQHELDDLLRLLQQEEGELEKALKQQMEAEAQTLPVIFNFVLSKAEADLVQSALSQLNTDPNIALVQLCKDVSHGETESSN